MSNIPNAGLRKTDEVKSFYEKRGVTAVLDAPMSLLYYEMLHLYPNAKFIHTHRDPVAWYKSFQSMYDAHAIISSAVEKYPWLLDVEPYFNQGNTLGHLITSRLFQNRWEDKEYVYKKVNEYTETVIDTIPREQLLLFKVQDGWEPLCAFLNVSVPSVPFPHENNGESFLTEVRRQTDAKVIEGRWRWYKRAAVSWECMFLVLVLVLWYGFASGRLLYVSGGRKRKTSFSQV